MESIFISFTYFVIIYKNVCHFMCITAGSFCLENYAMQWWEIQKEGDHWEDQDAEGWTILKWILER
jgi:hypothetical protein